MAKKTKDSNLSLEERLEQALIPNWDEPYKLPQNWCWSKLGSVSELYNGDRGANYPSKRDYVSEGIPFINAGAIQNNTIDETEFNFISKEKYEALRAGKIKKDDILYCLRGSLGKTALIATNLTGAISSSLCIIRAKNNVISKYLFYLLRSNFVVQQQIKAENGSAQPNLSAASVMEYVLPIAPLEEQKRIVSRVESLFSKLDETQEKAQEVVDGFETRKAAILHKAFSGELTAKWREENGVLYNTWVTKALEDVCKSIYDGDHMPPPKSENGIPFLVISNVNTGYLSFEDTRFVPKEYYANITDTRKPQKGDVLYTLVGSYGIPVVVDTDKAFCFQRHMALLKPLSVDTYFLWYLLQTQEMYQKASAIAKGVAQLTVPIKGLRAMKFSCPSIEEQQEVVRLLDMLVKKEQFVKETAEAVIEQIDTMKKAILARAFRGELGTNDPSEESAVELLKNVLGEDVAVQTPAKNPTKRISIPSYIKDLLSNIREEEIIKLLLKSAPQSVSVQEIMALSSKKFELMDALRSLEKKQFITKNESGKYSLTR